MIGTLSYGAAATSPLVFRQVIGDSTTALIRALLGHVLSPASNEDAPSRHARQLKAAGSKPSRRKLLRSQFNRARHHIVSSLALLAAMSSGSSAFAVEWLVPTGGIEVTGITLGTGDSLTNSGAITRSIGAPVNYGGIGTISVIHNTQTGRISSNGTPAINIDGNLTRFENNGQIWSDGTEGLVVSGTLGWFLNTGTMSNVNDRSVAV